ncbi:beta strand repeat-containing protein [Telmatospirillum siberiense]|uniref:Uncharacterized protein n=1 Tax=Telmatospirillum siberiense TaxID=382514 RepID=A0A2N3PM18_9PROT|nr:calcium-binding protein [Telmatospirillum siberiense]PKU21458.1 hypothetical protein CWS72_26645 [Telmatospirillum siberiense]
MPSADVISQTFTFLKQSEGLRLYIYNDSRGIPTMAIGVALVVYSDGKWGTVKNLDALLTEAGVPASSLVAGNDANGQPTAYQQLLNALDQRADDLTTNNGTMTRQSGWTVATDTTFANPSTGAGNQYGIQLTNPGAQAVATDAITTLYNKYSAAPSATNPYGFGASWNALNSDQQVSILRLAYNVGSPGASLYAALTQKDASGNPAPDFLRAGLEAMVNSNGGFVGNTANSDWSIAQPFLQSWLTSGVGASATDLATLAQFAPQIDRYLSGLIGKGAGSDVVTEIANSVASLYNQAAPAEGLSGTFQVNNGQIVYVASAADTNIGAIATALGASVLALEVANPGLYGGAGGVAGQTLQSPTNAALFVAALLQQQGVAPGSETSSQFTAQVSALSQEWAGSVANLPIGTDLKGADLSHITLLGDPGNPNQTLTLPAGFTGWVIEGADGTFALVPPAAGVAKTNITLLKQDGSASAIALGGNSVVSFQKLPGTADKVQFTLSNHRTVTAYTDPTLGAVTAIQQQLLAQASVPTSVPSIISVEVIIPEDGGPSSGMITYSDGTTQTGSSGSFDAQSGSLSVTTSIAGTGVSGQPVQFTMDENGGGTVTTAGGAAYSFASGLTPVINADGTVSVSSSLGTLSITPSSGAGTFAAAGGTTVALDGTQAVDLTAAGLRVGGLSVNADGSGTIAAGGASLSFGAGSSLRLSDGGAVVTSADGTNAASVTSDGGLSVDGVTVAAGSWTGLTLEGEGRFDVSLSGGAGTLSFDADSGTLAGPGGTALSLGSAPSVSVADGAAVIDLGAESSGVSRRLVLAGDGGLSYQVGGETVVSAPAGSTVTVDGTGLVAITTPAGALDGTTLTTLIDGDNNVALMGVSSAGSWATSYGADGTVGLIIAKSADDSFVFEGERDPVSGTFSITQASLLGASYGGEGDFSGWVDQVMASADGQEEAAAASAYGQLLSNQFDTIDNGGTAGLPADVAALVALAVQLRAAKADEVFLAARLGLGGMSDKWADIVLAAEDPGLFASVDAAAAAANNVAMAGIYSLIAPQIREMPSIITAEVIGFGDPEDPNNAQWKITWSSLGISFPLVLDLSGTGIDLVPEATSGVTFDVNDSGTAVPVGWVGKSNGILVFDANHNGTIDDAGEWFGQKFSVNGSTPPAGQTGFQALATLATAGADSFSAATSLIDAATGKLYFDEVEVWVDANGNGVTDAGELHTLQQLGITSISLSSTTVDQEVSGNVVLSTARYQTSDGTSHTIDDIGLATTAGASRTASATDGPAILAFGEIVAQAFPGVAAGQAQAAAVAVKGVSTDFSADITSMRQYMGTARGMEIDGIYSNRFFYTPDPSKVWAYSGAGQESNNAPAEVISVLSAIGGGAASVEAAAQTVAIGADALGTAQAAALAADTDPTAASLAAAKASAEQAGSQWAAAIDGYLAANASLAGVGAMVAAAESDLAALVPVDFEVTGHLPNGFTYWSIGDVDLAEAAFGGLADGLAAYASLKDALETVLGATAQAGDYEKALVGADGQLTQAGQGRDLLLAAGGTETFAAGGGHDDFVFTPSSGNAVIKGFVAGASGDQLQFLGVGAGIIVGDDGAGGTVITYGNGGRVDLAGVAPGQLDLFANVAGVDTVSFAGSVNAGTRSLGGAPLFMDGEVHVHDLVASDHGDVLIGDQGADTLTGGAGNDTLISGGGDNSYVIDAGGGRDLIVNGAAGSGTREGELLLDAAATTGGMWFSRSGNDLVAQVLGTTSTVTIAGWFSGGAAQLGTIAAADGSSLSAAAVNRLERAMAAYQQSNPAFNPGTASSAPDLQAFLTFDAGDGAVVISGGAGVSLKLGPSLNPGNLWFLQSGDDLVIQVGSGTGRTTTQTTNGTATNTLDTLTVKNWFTGASAQVQSLILSDGSSIGAAAITALAQAMTPFYQAWIGDYTAAGQEMTPAGFDYAYHFTSAAALNEGWSRTLVAGSGNQFLDTWFGYDTILGGAGDHTLIGDDERIGSTELIYAGAPGTVTVDLSAGLAQNGFGGTDTLIDIDVVTLIGNDGTLIGSAPGGNFPTLIARGDGNLLEAGGNAAALIETGNSSVLIGWTGSGKGGAALMEAVGTDDTLLGGAGEVTLTTEGGGNTLIGGVAAFVPTFQNGVTATGYYTTQILSATGDRNLLSAGSGGMTLTETGNASTLLGSSQPYAGGPDLLIATGNGNTLIADTGRNTLVASGYGNTLIGDTGRIWPGLAYDDTLLATGGGNVLIAGIGDDLLCATGDASTLVGGTGDDTLTASGSGETLIAGKGAATLSARGDGDTLLGGAGEDLLMADGTQEILTGGSGDATLSVTGDANLLTGGTGTDTLLAAGAGNLLRAKGIADVLSAAGRRNTLVAGGGTDTLLETGGANTLVGGAGTSTLAAFDDGNLLTAGSGTNSLLAVGQANTLVAGSGTGILSVTGDVNTLIGGSGADFLSATGDANTLLGGGGVQSLVAMGGGNLLAAGSGLDVLSVNGSANTLTGGAGSDLLTATGAGNTLIGGAGLAVLESDASGNTLIAGGGVTVAAYGVGNLTVDLGKGVARVNGAAGGDTLLGGIATLESYGSHDTLTAGGGNDWILLAGAADTAIGGAGVTTLVSDLAGNTLIGGTGRTEVFYTGDHVAVDLKAGLGTSSGGVGTGDRLIGLTAAAVSGSADTLIGTATGGALLQALGGTGDTLMASGGGNTLVGGMGMTTLVSAAVGGNTLIAGSGGAEAIFSGAGIAVDLGAGRATANGAVADTLAGTFAVAAALGAGDTLIGGAGTSTLVGDLSGSTLVAGTGVTWGWYGADHAVVDLGAGGAGVTGGGQDRLIGLTDAAVAGADDTLIAGGHDTLAALGNGDTLVAKGGGNVLLGGAFVSTLAGDLAGSTLVAGSGPTVAVYGTAGTVVDLATGLATAGGASDTLAGITVAAASGGGETLIGTAGGSTLIGSGAGDTLIGGSTLTEAYYAGGGMTVDLGAGTAEQNGADWGDILIGIKRAAVSDDGNVLVAANGDVAIALSGRNNTLIAEGSGDTLEAGTGTTTLIGDAAGNVMLGGTGRTVAYYAADDVAIDLTAGTARVAGAAVGDTVLGLKNVVLTGSDQTLIGTATGGDVLVAMQGQDDTLIAEGAGNTLLGGAGTSTLIGDGLGNTLIAGAGLTRASFGGSFVTVDLNAGTARVNGSTTFDTLIGIKAVQVFGYGDTLIGSAAGGDDLEITGLNDTLIANGGGDVLRGGTSAGTLASNAAGNTLIAGSGKVIAYYAADDVTVDLTAGRAGVNGATAADTLVGISAAEAAGSGDTLIGGTGRSTLVGDLEGGTLIAGAGRALAVYQAAGSVVDLGAGTARPAAAGLGDTLVGISDGLIEGAGATLIGAAGGSTLVATSAGDTLVSRAASDTLIGAAGVAADYLAAGLVVNLAAGTVAGNSGNGVISGLSNVTVAGNNDTLIGSGIDTLVATGSGDVVFDGGGAGTLIAAGNHDTLVASAPSTLIGDGAGNTLIGSIENILRIQVSWNNWCNSWSKLKADGLAAYAADGAVVQLTATSTWAYNPSTSSETETTTTSGTAAVAGVGTGDVLANIIAVEAAGDHDTLIANSDPTGLITLIATGSHDTLAAGGTSTLISNLADNTLIGGDAFYTTDGVTISLAGGWARAAGASLSDSLIGVTMAEVSGDRAALRGGAGDTLVAAGDNDTLVGGGTLVTSVQTTTLFDSGGTLITSSVYENTLVGSDGTLTASGTNDTLIGSGGGTLFAAGTNDTLIGSGSDVLIATGDNETLIGSGNGTLIATGANDVLIGSSGETIIASGAGDTVWAEGFKDTIGSVVYGYRVTGEYLNTFGSYYERYEDDGYVSSTYRYLLASIVVDPGTNDLQLDTVEGSFLESIGGRSVLAAGSGSFLNLNLWSWDNIGVAQAVGHRDELIGLSQGASTLMTDDWSNTLFGNGSGLTEAYLYTDDATLNFSNNGTGQPLVWPGGSDTLIGINVGVAGGNNDILVAYLQDTLEGGLGTSTLIGNGQANTLIAGAGPTICFGGGFVDLGLGEEFKNGGWDQLIGITIAESAGSNSTLIGGLGSTTLIDNVNGSWGNNTLIAGSGPTEVYYSMDRVSLNLGTGIATAGLSDTLIGRFAIAVAAGWLDTIVGGSASMLLEAAGNYDTLVGGSGSSTLVGNGDANELIAGSGSSELYYSSNYISIDLWAGTAMAHDQWGSDLYQTPHYSYINAYPYSYIDYYIQDYDTLSGTFSSVVVAGNNDTVVGGPLSNVLVAAGNGDTLTSWGQSTLIASGDNDTLIAGGGDTLIASGRGDQLFGSGLDTLIATGNGETLVGEAADTLVAAGRGNLLDGSGISGGTIVGNLGGNTLVGDVRYSFFGQPMVDYAANGLTVDLDNGSPVFINDGIGGILQEIDGWAGSSGGSDTLVNIYAVEVTGNFDTLIGEEFGNATLIAVGANNTLIGAGSDNTLAIMGGMNDVVIGSGDSLRGDTLITDDANGNTLNANNEFGGALLYYSEGNLTIDLRVGKSMAATTGKSDTLIGLFSYVEVTGDHDTLINSDAGNGTTLEANGHDNTLIGGDDSPTLVSDAVGGNTLIAGLGPTTVAYNASDAVMDLGSGTVWQNGGRAADMLVGAIAAAQISGDYDTLIGSRAGGNTLEAFGSGDTVIGSSVGGNLLSASGSGQIVIANGDGNTLRGYGWGQYVTLISNIANNTLSAWNTNVIAAYTGNGIVADLAIGTVGARSSNMHDSLVGVSIVQVNGADDTLIGGSAADTLISNGVGNTLIAGSGATTAGFLADDVVIDTRAGIATVKGSNLIDTLVGVMSAYLVTGNDDTLIGSSTGHQTLIASSGVGNTLIASGTANTLEGGRGSSTLFSSLGSNTLIGGTGLTSALYDGSGLVIYCKYVDYATVGLAVDWTGTSFSGGPVDILWDISIAGTAGSNNTLIGGGQYSTLTSNLGGNTLINGAAYYSNNFAAIDLGAGKAMANGSSLVADKLIGVSVLEVGGSHDTLISAAGDTLTASGLFDTLVAGTGSNRLIATGGNDFYDFGRGSGQAFIVNGAAGNAGPSNELDFGAGSSDDQLWFTQSGNDLQIDVMGSSSEVTVSNWFAGTGNQLSEITAGGLKIDGQIAQLVQAMAVYSANHPGFAPGALANTRAPSDPVLQGAIAAAWH